MRNILITVFGFCVAAFVLAAAEPQKPPSDIPPGVGTEEWIPLGQSFGFAVTSPTNNNVEEFVDNTRALHGYYMIKKSDKWYRTYPPGDPNIRRIPFRRVSPDSSSTNATSTVPFRSSGTGN